jgi:hypothetical protein
MSDTNETKVITKRRRPRNGDSVKTTVSLSAANTAWVHAESELRGESFSLILDTILTERRERDAKGPVAAAPLSTEEVEL